MKFFQVAGAFGDNEQANRVFWKYFDFTSFLSYYLLPCEQSDTPVCFMSEKSL